MSLNSLQNQIAPPPALIKIWFQLLQDDNEETYEYAKEKLLDIFGNMRNVVEYAKKNNIEVWYR